MRTHDSLLALSIGLAAVLALISEAARADDYPYSSIGEPYYGRSMYYDFAPVQGYSSYIDSQPRDFQSLTLGSPHFRLRSYLLPPVYWQPSSGLRPAAAGPTTIISIGDDDEFDPQKVHVQPGTTITWVNEGQRRHAITSEKGSWRSGELAPGATHSVTYYIPGTYSYHNRSHKGMKGTVVVGGSNGSSSSSDSGSDDSGP